MMLIADSSSEILQTRKEWQGILKTMKINNPASISLRFYGEINEEKEIKGIQIGNEELKLTFCK